tara:strand:- start:353 stop:619 length:267 start_codon:yes stop_codon:yes gene_type:complete
MLIDDKNIENFAKANPLNNGWWCIRAIAPKMPGKIGKSFGHIERGQPKHCLKCDRAWHGNKKVDWGYIDDFPKYGCYKETCRNCKEER